MNRFLKEEGWAVLIQKGIVDFYFARSEQTRLTAWATPPRLSDATSISTTWDFIEGPDGISSVQTASVGGLAGSWH